MSKPNKPASANAGGGAPPVPVHTIAIDEMYENWFMDYASYVILERAVPRVEDGLKPVQRRIMHALKEMDDGRFNKVANVIGSTMQYHPHGDAAIGEAIINIGQKDILFDTQGNWGDVRTGDSAAAPRYIEVRPSQFALDVVYNPQTTAWQLSYDGRKKEPVTLPVKFPLLLAQGVEGIAVGLSTKILPHNFVELVKASIDVLKGKNPKIYPDFPTGGVADVAEYDQGARGGKVKVRARIDILDKKTLAVREIPFGTTTPSLIESIVKASEKGKIKVKQVIDNTARDVEILIHLQPGQSPEIAMDALFAFTDCEVSLSPNACVIVDDKPRFLKVNEILKINTESTVQLLKRELEIRLGELKEKILFGSLEKIFIEKRIYRSIEEVDSFEGVIETIDNGLKPFKKQFYREITRDDILRLMEIRIKRISKYDSFKADELLRNLEKELKDTLHHLKHLNDYAIGYFQGLLEKYGKDRERRTELKSFQAVAATEVIANNQKLYVNREDGFIGWGLKKDEFVAECSELDDIIVLRKDGKAVVSRISEKVFVGKDILHVGVWRKGDERMVYNMVYTDAGTGKGFAKRFAMPAVIRDKEYDLTTGHANNKVHYLSANANGEAEVVEVKLTPSSTARKKIFDFDFSELEIKGRGARGNVITKYPIRKVEFKESKGSTLGGLELWYDMASGRLNKEQRGKRLGKFREDDRIIAVTRGGTYRITDFNTTNRYDPEKVIWLEKFNPKKVLSAIYFDGDSKQYFVKRFLIETTTLDKEFDFIAEAIGSRLEFISSQDSPEVELELSKGKDKAKVTEAVNLEEVVEVKGWKSVGNRLSSFKVIRIRAQEEAEEGAGADEAGEADEDAPLKKKEEPQPLIEADGQTALFQPSPPPKKESPARPKKEDQGQLFEPQKKQQEKSERPNEGDEETGFTPGQSVEWNF